MANDVGSTESSDIGDGKTDQTREIEGVLNQAADDEWTLWTQSIQSQVDKLIDGKRVDRYAIFALGGIGLLCCGAVAVLGKAVQGLAQGMSQLGENQAYIGHVIGLDKHPTTPMEAMKHVSTEAAMGEPITNGASLEDIRIQDPKTFDVPNGGKVAVAEGPASETSEATRAQLAADKEAGIIDEFTNNDEPV